MGSFQCITVKEKILSSFLSQDPQYTGSTFNEIQLALSLFNGSSWIEAKWINVVPDLIMYQEVLSLRFNIYNSVSAVVPGEPN